MSRAFTSRFQQPHRPASRTYPVVPAPHVSTAESVPHLMWTTVIALLPVLLASIVAFPWRAFTLIGLALVLSAGLEAVTHKLLRRDFTLPDGSVTVTALLFALLLPPTATVWSVTVGLFVAVVLAKAFFGGLGKNLFNPAVMGFAVALMVFPSNTTYHPVHIPVSVWHIAWHAAPDSLGGASALAVLAGGGILLLRRVIGWHMPLAYLGTLALLSWIVDALPLSVLLRGEVLLAAVFLITDPVTSPLTRRGETFFAAACAAVTTLLWLWLDYPAGLACGILALNAVVPLIDRFMRPRIMGERQPWGVL